MTTSAEIQALEILSRCLGIPTEAGRTARLRVTPEWDSFAHVEIVVEVEERTCSNLTQEEVEQLTSYEVLVELLESLGARG